MSKLVRGLIILLLALAIGGAYWYGRVQGGRIGPGRSAAGNVVQNITIETEQKTEAGAIYGEFTAVVQLKNTTAQPIRQLKVVCQQVHSLSQNPLSVPKVESKILYVPEIKPGKEHTLRFTGFKPQHPEEQQEIIASVMGYNGLGKLPYKVVFPPNSKD